MSKRLTPASGQTSTRRVASANVAGAPGFEEFVAAAERAGAETENGNLETGMAELSEFHGGLDALRNS